MTNRQDNGPHRSSTMNCSLEFIKYCHIEITKPIRLDRKAPIAVPNIQINPLLALDLTSGVKGGSLRMSFTSVCFIFVTPSFEGFNFFFELIILSVSSPCRKSIIEI